MHVQPSNRLAPCCWHVVGTPYNRRTFLLAAASSLQPLAALGPFSPADCHSMLLLLCPDFPLTSVKNAWATAVELAVTEQQPVSALAAAASSASADACASMVQRGTAAAAASSGDGGAVTLPAFLSALGPVLVYERWLLQLRAQCFDERKICECRPWLTAAGACVLAWAVPRAAAAGANNQSA